MTSKKNENRQTTVKGIMANPATQTFEEFEVKTPYTRSTIKAVELARDILKCNPAVMVSVTELMQEEVKKTEYHAQLIYENMAEDFETMEEAESANAAKDFSYSVIAYTMYHYDAQVWIKDGDDYMTLFITDYSPLKLTKVDARALLKMAAENNYGGEVIGVHGDTREASKRFALITPEKLAECVKK